MSTYVDNWDNDRGQLMGGGIDPKTGQPYYGDINTAEDENTEYCGKDPNVRGGSLLAYDQGWDKVLKTADPMEAYVLLFVMMADQGMDVLTDKTAVDAGGLQVQGDLTRLGNDMEDMTTQDADKSKGYVNLVAARGEDMINTILGNADIKNIIGLQPASQLSSQYIIIREQIHVDGSQSQYNGDLSSANCYFYEGANVDPSKAGPTDKMNSYGQLHDGLGLRGDPYSSNEAQKGMTNAFNENTSTTQSTNAASQEIISNDQNNAKGVQSFIVAGLHSVTDVESAAIKAVGKG